MTRARAMATRWRIPPESWAGLAFSNPPSPTSSTSSATASGSWRRPTSSRASRMLAATDRQGSSDGSWKATPMRRWRRSSSGEAPAMSMEPSSGWSSPATSRRAVDLPQPEGPMRAQNPPGGTCRSKPARAVTSPAPRAKVRPTPTTSTGAPRRVAVTGTGPSHPG